MKNVIGLILKATITMALVACAGQSSDPREDYKDVKAVPVHNEQSQSQNFYVDKFSAEIIGPNETNYGDFIEGQQGEVTVKITPKVPHIDTPTIEIVNFPSADQPKVTQVSNDAYKLTWTPKAGTIPPGQTQTKINFEIKINSDGQYDLVKTLFLVSRTNKVPKIKGTTGLNVSAQEGQTIKFTVDIEDPNYNGSGTPEVLISPYMNSNIEAFMANGSTYVFQNYEQKQNPVQYANGLFRFYYVMKLDKLPDLYDRKGKIDPNAASVQLCFNLRAVSVVKTTSETIQHCINASYAAQPAEIQFNTTDRKVIAGQKNSIGFKLSTANGLSNIEIKNAKNQIANLSGEKELTCTSADDKNTSLNCELTWTPSCKITSKNSSLLKLKIDSILNRKSKITNINEQFEMNDETCKAQALAKAEADKKAKEEKALAKKSTTTKSSKSSSKSESKS